MEALAGLVASILVFFGGISNDVGQLASAQFEGAKDNPVELGLTEFSPRGEAGGYAMPASGDSFSQGACTLAFVDDPHPVGTTNEFYFDLQPSGDSNRDNKAVDQVVIERCNADSVLFGCYDYTKHYDSSNVCISGSPLDPCSAGDLVLVWETRIEVTYLFGTYSTTTYDVLTPQSPEMIDLSGVSEGDWDYYLTANYWEQAALAIDSYAAECGYELTTGSSFPECSDGVDNADPEDSLADEADPGCHTDGDASNSSSYDPADDNEEDSAPPLVDDDLYFTYLLIDGSLPSGQELAIGNTVDIEYQVHNDGSTTSDEYRVWMEVQRREVISGTPTWVTSTSSDHDPGPKIGVDNTKSYVRSWTVPPLYDSADGKDNYRIRVHLYDPGTTNRYSFDTDSPSGNDFRPETGWYYFAAFAPPIVTLSANPNPIPINTNSTLSWSISGVADSCTASAGLPGWSGAKNAAGGSEPHGPHTADTLYRIQCEGPGGSSPVVEEIVDVVTAPIADLTACRWDGSSATDCIGPGETLLIAEGDDIRLEWDGGADDTTVCDPVQGKDFDTNGGARSGTDIISTLLASDDPETYEVHCYNVAGDAYAELEIRIGTVCGPDTGLEAVDIVRAGNSFSLFWQKPLDIASCIVAGGGVSVNAGENTPAPPNQCVEQNVYPVTIEHETQFTMSCDYPPDQSTVNVQVIPQVEEI